MNQELLNQTAKVITQHGYFYMFLAMLIEGPIVTLAASMASVWGVFNIFVVFLVSIPGDLVADVIYYALGYWFKDKIVDKFMAKMGVSLNKANKFESMIRKNPVKTLLFIKLAPVLPTPGLMIAGSCKVPLKDYIKICTYIIIPKSIFFVVLGYLCGIAGKSALQYVSNSNLIFLGAIAGFLVVNWVYKKISAKISKAVEKNTIL